ncbi:MAG: succinylglutamate desuccinylase/aspartoacylase family protein [Burkholderiales bacterium]
MSNAAPGSTAPFNIVAIKSGGAGPRLIVLGAVHGNEICGPRAIERVLAEFGSAKLGLLRGHVTFVPITNQKAYERVQREGDRNLNRNLGPSEHPQDFEDRIANALCPLLAQHDVLIDLHSFHSPGEPFAMVGPTDNAGSLQPFALAAQEEALAVRLGPRRLVEGWLETYAEGVAARVKRAEHSDDPLLARARLLNTDPRYGVGTTEYMRSVGGMAITLECGQHDDPAGPEVAYRAIINTMAHLRMIDVPAPAPRTDVEVLRLIHVTDRLNAGDTFIKAWASFDPVKAGEPIGHRHDGTVVSSPGDGFIVFPNTKSMPGNEWFYFAGRSSRPLNLG